LHKIEKENNKKALTKEEAKKILDKLKNFVFTKTFCCKNLICLLEKGATLRNNLINEQHARLSTVLNGQSNLFLND